MTRSPTSPWLLLLATAAAISTSVDAFAHRSSVMGRRNSFVHQKLLPLHFSATEIEEIPLDVVSASDIATPEDAKDMLALNLSEVGPEGVMPFAPMMTFKKFVTMQEKRVRVSIRYSADAGLRPFYLTVASRIKSAHPDVILEKRILPNPAGSDSTESIFEVQVDGKTVIGKKKIKMLKVRTSGSSSSPRNEDGDDDKNAKDKNEGTDSDIAGGKSIFVSMEKLEQELNKARKKRRPSTMYKSKELLRNGVEDSIAGVGGVGGEGPVSGTSEAVLRLEKLKAMSSRKN